jgi:hypothetical protein
MIENEESENSEGQGRRRFQNVDSEDDVTGGNSLTWSRVGKGDLMYGTSGGGETSGVSSYLKSSTRRSLSTQNNFIDFGAVNLEKIE